MPTYNDITNAMVDPDSPGTQNLFTYMRDNPLATRKWARKAAITTINNDNTPNNDPDLQLAVVGGQTWIFTGYLIVISTNNAHFRIHFLTPDVVNDVGYVFLSQHVISVGVPVTADDGRGLINADIDSGNWSAAGNTAYMLSAYVILDATPAAGTVIFQWSATAVHGDNTSVDAHSYLYGLRVDPT